MRCWQSISARALGVPALLFALLLGLLLPLPAKAALIEPTEAQLTLDESDGLLAAAFAIDLGSRLEDALTRGITLSFKLECVIERPRDYWVDEHISSYAQSYRLSYSGLTRQYRITIGSLHQNFASLPDALRLLGRASALPVIERSKLLPATRYEAAVRLTLDASQLPKPFQLDALTSNAWKVESKTRRWSFQTP
ncbi:MAG: DUF4390 domain-containing protein [Rhodocyclaceae bacterium]|jgi:hypothetical protein|nr:DUF4390 domain-containing protein [Rhodocyclaceae bacterium]MBK6908936.1 DUF4390 domain-containing protein [Rhodocyclaceae bacterium]